MSQKNRVEFARQSFVANRHTAEGKLKEMRKYMQQLLDFRHGRTDASALLRILMWLPYLWEKRNLLPQLRETRWKIRFYRKVEVDLERGDLGSAIEALSVFAPREETVAETVRRVRTQPATVWAIQRSPHIMRTNMLRLREDLIKIQRTRTC